MTEEKGALRARTLGRDELNLAEFPLSLIGRRAPGNAKTLQFSDETYDRSLGRYVTRRLTVSAADLLGLPTAIDDEVLLACMQLSHEQKFKSPKVRFERSHLLDILDWKRSGKDYRRLTDSLHRWKGTLIISENAFWDRGEQCWVNDSFSILNRVTISGRGRKEEGRDIASSFEWGDFMWRSIESGNLRRLDFEFLKSLDSTISKRLYRLLSKRFYHGSTVRFGLRTLAHEKVGLSRNMHTGQIKEKLNRGHTELESRGVCRSTYVKQPRGDWEVVYTAIGAETRATAVAACPLTEALSSRGVQRAASLVRRASRERIERAIENYDDRCEQGEKIGPGWLRECITREVPFGFRRGYTSKAELDDAKKQKALREKADKESKRRAEMLKRQQYDRCWREFQTFLDAFPTDAEREAFAARATEANRYMKTFIIDSHEQGDVETAERHRQTAMFMLWEKERAHTANNHG